ncbi:unnamed protein product [Camellia sinensis]
MTCNTCHLHLLQPYFVHGVVKSVSFIWATHHQREASESICRPDLVVEGSNPRRFGSRSPLRQLRIHHVDQIYLRYDLCLHRSPESQPMRGSRSP